MEAVTEGCLLGKTVRFRTNVLYHLLKKIGKEPSADLFPFMKGNNSHGPFGPRVAQRPHQRTEEQIKFVFDHLGWSYSPVPPWSGAQGPPLASKVSLNPSTCNP